MRSRRFDSQEYLDAWRDRGEYPVIHEDIAAVAHTILHPDAATLDLCCSTGLLGRRFHEDGWQVHAIDGSVEALARGRDAGVLADGLPSALFPIRNDTLGLLAAFIGHRNITQVLARRCLYEIAASGVDMDAFTTALWEAGVRDIVLEGHHVVPDGDPRLSADAQAQLLHEHYEPVGRYRRVRHLRAVH